MRGWQSESRGRRRVRWDALGSHQVLKTRFRPVRRKELKDSFHSLSETVYKKGASGPRDKEQCRDEGERAMGEEGATCREGQRKKIQYWVRLHSHHRRQQRRV